MCESVLCVLIGLYNHCNQIVTVRVHLGNVCDNVPLLTKQTKLPK